MTDRTAPITPADEFFHHQIVDSFASVATTDLAWTEKVCAMAMARDGSLQLGFGLGKYTNRNVMDGYAAISRGTEQVTVRGSRRLDPEPDTTVIGPIRYEIVEPLKKIRFICEPNETQPIAFDWLFEAVAPCVFEERTFQRRVYRVSAELIRYHQTGVCSGWVEVDGVRTEITPDTWVSTRDHSWGVRYDVGQPLTDLEPGFPTEQLRWTMAWSPTLFERADGSRYATHLHYTIFDVPGHSSKSVMGGIEHPDGTIDRWVDVVPELSYHPVNRRLQGGRITLTTADGGSKAYSVEVMGDTGVHLGAGLYFGFKGHHHGDWRGDLVVEGERIPDCTDPEWFQQLHQIRDTTVRLTDLDTGDVGWGNWQPIVCGAWPELGLTQDTTFI
jgi:hypothetical protein